MPKPPAPATPLQYLKGVGEKRALTLKKLGLNTLEDLATYYPRAYEDRSVITPIAELSVDDPTPFAVIGVIVNVREKSFGPAGKFGRSPKKNLITATLSDGTGYLQATWFNQPFLKKSLAIGSRLLLYGKIGYAYGSSGMLAMTRLISHEILEADGNASPKGILPVYQATENITQKYLRRLVETLWQSPPDFPDFVPENIRRQYGLLPRQSALMAIHFPPDDKTLKKARDSLAFEELYIIQCGLLLLKKDSQTKVAGLRHLMSSRLVAAALACLPFELTADQKKAWREIERDMENDVPMRRLLEGDVGSGKTAIALLALVKTVENGYQGAFMAPTEILSHQHFAKFSQILASLPVRLGLLTGELTPKKKRALLEAIAQKQIDIVIGTHAIIEEAVKFAALGLVVTDEQHRFGVSQRAALEKKGAHPPDVLVMTATPIPRTMTLTVYGDLDISRIEHLPPGRRAIRTFVRESDRRRLIYEFVKNQIAAGRQAYVVCPIIEESQDETGEKNSPVLPSAEEVYAELSRGIFQNIDIGIVHGRLKAAEKKATMEKFYQGKIKLLVATTVIEVGVDVPNASIMVIENADRFGLAQLHQLRGRIGRGEYQSYCILIAGSRSPLARERLEVLKDTASGFDVAEADLRLRGAGQFFGSMQHGMGDLKIVNILKDTDILIQARNAAIATMNDASSLEAIRPYLAAKYHDKFAQINDA